MRTPLKSVLNALGLKLKKEPKDGECVIEKCSKPGRGLFNLCAGHKKPYAKEQHRQAQHRVNARRQTGAPPQRPLIARHGKLTPWAKANPKKALVLAAKSQGDLAKKMKGALTSLVKAA